ncbi:hypothetical protein ACJX0J_016235, partial [Zea mays]
TERNGCMELIGLISIISKLRSNYRLTLKHHNVRHHYIREAVASGWKQHIMFSGTSFRYLKIVENLYTWDIVGGHTEIIHTERMLMHLMGDIEN